MAVSVFDLFKIGIGPSSSHTVGPMRAAAMFAGSLERDGLLPAVCGVRAELFGSLGATGHGHGSVKAVVLGLSGAHPETVDPAAADPLVTSVRETGTLRLLGHVPISFNVDEDVILHRARRRGRGTGGPDVLLGRWRLRPRRGRSRAPGCRCRPDASSVPVCQRG